MFKCESCLNQIPAKIPSTLIPTVIRRKIYPARFINMKHEQGKKERYSDKKHFDEEEALLKPCMKCAFV